VWYVLMVCVYFGDVWMYVWTDGWMDRWIDGWMKNEETERIGWKRSS